MVCLDDSLHLTVTSSVFEVWVVSAREYPVPPGPLVARPLLVAPQFEVGTCRTLRKLIRTQLQVR